MEGKGRGAKKNQELRKKGENGMEGKKGKGEIISRGGKEKRNWGRGE